MSNTQTDDTQQPATGTFEQIELEAPIKRGNQTVKTITLRKPKAGELRGLKLADLVQMDVDACTQVLPRISDPVLDTREIADMTPADLLQISAGIAGFLLPKDNTQNNAA